MQPSISDEEADSFAASISRKGPDPWNTSNDSPWSTSGVAPDQVSGDSHGGGGDGGGYGGGFDGGYGGGKGGGGGFDSGFEEKIRSRDDDKSRSRDRKVGRKDDHEHQQQHQYSSCSTDGMAAVSMSQLLNAINANGDKQERANAALSSKMASIEANTAGLTADMERVSAAQSVLSTQHGEMAARQVKLEQAFSGIDAKMAEQIKAALSLQAGVALSSASTDVPASVNPGPKEYGCLNMHNFCDFAVVKVSGPDGDSIRAYVMGWVNSLEPALRSLFGDTGYQVVSVLPQFQRHATCKIHMIRVVSEPEACSLVELFSAWAPGHLFRDRKVQLAIPKEPGQEAAEASLRTVKRMLGQAIVLKPRYELQCRYQSRRVVVVSQDDPKYSREVQGAPKSTVLAGIAIQTGLPFVELPCINQVCDVRLEDKADLEQEMAAALR